MTTTDPVIDSALLPTFPGDHYTDPVLLAREKVRIFERQWVFAGLAAELDSPGKFLRVTVGRETVIVVRGRDGSAHAFLNVCRHRGAQLCLDSSGTVGKAIRCPYHAWTYGLDGKLITAPNWEAMSHIDRSSYSLHGVRLDVWHGLIWVTLSADTPPLARQLTPQIEFRLGTPAAEVLARYGIADLVVGRRVTYDVRANWKLIMENFQECYHCATIHPELADAIPAFRAADAATDGYDTEGYRFAEGRDSFSLSGKRQLPPLPGLRPDDDLKYFGMVLRPNAFLSLTPDHVIVHRFEPVSPTHTKATCDWLFPREVVEGAEYDVSDAVALFHRVNEQDFQAAEGCQPNMGSRAYERGGVLAPSERLLIGRWYGWYRSLMADEG